MFPEISADGIDSLELTDWLSEMDPRAVKQAEQRLRKAGKAFLKLCGTKDAEKIKENWVEFLTLSATIFEKIKAGAGKSGSSYGWFGKKIKDRKDDPLLSYVQHARNSEQHGIEDITQTWDRHRFVGAAGSVLTGLNVPEGAIVGEIIAFDASGHRVRLTTSQSKEVRLVAVHDKKHNVSFDVPKSHLGNQLPDNLTPEYVAGLALEYLKDLIAQAKELVP